jgi:cytoskeletal protein RodZ
MNKKSIVWIVVGVVVVLIIAVAVFGHRGSSQNQPAAAQAPTNQTPAAGTSAAAPSSAPSAYTSSADAFSVQFPGTPTVTNLTYNSPTAGAVPLTEYKVASDESVNAYYGVYVYHYPAGYQFASDYLTTALTSFRDVINAKYPGATITSKTQTQFLGGTALSATITLPIGTEYALFTVKGLDAYIISSYGVSQSEYAAFLNSFAFAQ